jgi:hypothetical protein
LRGPIDDSRGHALRATCAKARAFDCRGHKGKGCANKKMSNAQRCKSRGL